MKHARHTVASILAAVALSVGTGAGATVARADSADPNGPECMCRFQGQRYHLGELACINSRLARCDMFLNNTSWTFIEDVCPTASMSPARNGLFVLPASYRPAAPLRSN